jgi:hypothetical protein
MELFTGTVPANKNYVTGTVPANKNYVTGTVPVNKNYVTGTVQNGYVPKTMHIAMSKA